MKPENILEANVLDIIFENRNKEYGAYALRRDYNRRLKTGISVMLGVVILFALFNISWNGKKTPLLTETYNIPDTLILETDKTPKPIPPPNKIAVASVEYTAPLMVKETADSFPDIDVLAKDVLISTETVDGPPASTVEAPVAAPAEVPPGAPIAEPEPEILTESEVPPMFPGGISALRRYLLKNLKFDFEDQEPGSRVEIKCRFVVGKDGHVDAVQIVKSAGKNAYDNEVLRVVKKMPQWQAGKQKNKDVAVFFTLPVVVEVPEQ